VFTWNSEPGLFPQEPGQTLAMVLSGTELQVVSTQKRFETGTKSKGNRTFAFLAYMDRPGNTVRPHVAAISGYQMREKPSPRVLANSIYTKQGTRTSLLHYLLLA
jgi:hypothetical protein